MFEDSLVVSQIQRTSPAARWTALASMSLQFALVALVIALPVLHPEKLAFHIDTPPILMSAPPAPPVPIEHVQPSSTSSATATPSAARLVTASPLSPRLLPQIDARPSLSPLPLRMGASDGIPQGLGVADAAHSPHIAVVPARAANDPVRVSSGVSAGMLIAPIRPVYPEIAKIAHVEGTVIVEAIISRTGTVKSLHVVSGPAMLQQAALDAIRTTRYQPYRLNGSPTEVQTTISINFRLGS